MFHIILIYSAQLSPQILKPAVADAIVELTAPIRAAFDANPDWQGVTLKAYPPPAPKQKKEKKQKDKGSRHPGAAKQETPKEETPKPAEQ